MRELKRRGFTEKQENASLSIVQVWYLQVIISLILVAGIFFVAKMELAPDLISRLHTEIQKEIPVENFYEKIVELKDTVVGAIPIQ